MYDANASNANQFLSKAATAALIVVAFLAALPFVPIAAVILLVQLILRRLNPDGDGKSSTAWLFAVGAAALVINIVVFAICFVWYRIQGKPLPPPPTYGSRG